MTAWLYFIMLTMGAALSVGIIAAMLLHYFFDEDGLGR